MICRCVAALQKQKNQENSKLHSFFVLWYISHWIFISYLDSVHTGRLCLKPIGSIDHFEMQKLFQAHAFPYTSTIPHTHSPSYGDDVPSVFRTANMLSHFSFFITFLAQYSTPKVATEESLRQFKAVYAQLTIEIYGFPSKFGVCCSAQYPQTHDISRNERSTWTFNTHRTKKNKKKTCQHNIVVEVWHFTFNSSSHLGRPIFISASAKAHVFFISRIRHRWKHCSADNMNIAFHFCIRLRDNLLLLLSAYFCDRNFASKFSG